MSSRSPSPDGGAQHSDSGRSRSGRDEDDMGSKSDVGLDLVFLPGHRGFSSRRRRYRGGGRPGIRGRGLGRVAAARRHVRR